MQSLDIAISQVCERVRAAHADGHSLRIRGGGSKNFYTGLAQAPLSAGAAPAQWLETRALAGVVSYEPSELVVVVGAGTPLAELEALLASKGQYLPFEPPHFSAEAEVGPATVGGMVACGLAGPARASVGSVRDYVLGVRMVNGLAQSLTFGGQVMKNVAGYDVSRLMAGSLGTLGLLTEISLKVLPQPVAQATLAFDVDQTAALEHLHAWGGRPLPLNASAWQADAPGDGRGQGGTLRLRLRGAEAAVAAACQQLLAELPGRRLEEAEADAFWRACRDHRLEFFQQAPFAGAQLWRLSVPQTAAVSAPDFAHALTEWHGGLRWVWAEPGRADHLVHLARTLGGHAQAMYASSYGDGTAPRLVNPDPAQAEIARRLKNRFDPHGLFNLGLTPHAN